jgi:hypothetical protein
VHPVVERPALVANGGSKSDLPSEPHRKLAGWLSAPLVSLCLSGIEKRVRTGRAPVAGGTPQVETLSNASMG